MFILCKNISAAIKKGDPQVTRELYCGYQISVTGQCNFTKLNNKHSSPTTPNKKQKKLCIQPGTKKGLKFDSKQNRTDVL